MITKLTILPGHESDWSRALFSNMDITDRKMAEERMSFINLHDMMTGLYNRVYFDEELARLEKSRIRPVSILVCDMDNLKVINDRFGHAEGDIALQNIANILKACFRTEDVVARIGGDEFAVLLPNVSAELAERIVQRIERDIANHNSKGVEEEQIGLSVGAATAEKGQGLVETFKTADDNMYCVKQKKKGINCN
jgi:diguanylate cyclase (GGDEF)-like protein